MRQLTGAGHRPGGRGWHGAWALLLLIVGMAVMLPGVARAQDAAAFTDAELDQMLAPIALYPDSLLSQVLMASTYPADVQDAVAWSKAHPDVKGDAAIQQVQDKAWEPAVQSLVAFPQVLAMMGGRPSDVQRLGDAFLADPARVMDRVQALRKQAQAAGNLKTTEQQKVSTTTENNKTVIIVEPAQPQTVYVPVYQPTVVYGAWAYPSYPPYYWPPPPYYYPPSSGAFVAGVFWGAAIVGVSNSLWGGCNWGRGDVNINVNKYNNVNVNHKITNNNNSFQHNAARRGDVPYRDSKSREQYGKKQAEGATNREAYRGKDGRDADRARAESALKERGADPAAGREKLQGADRDKAANAVRDSGRDNPAANRAAAGNDRGNGDRSPGASTQRASAGGSSGALSGVQNSAASRAETSRGQASQSSMNASRGGSAGASAAARSGGGASRSAAPRPSGGGRAGAGGARR